MSDGTVEQDGLRPTRKVAAASTSGAAGVVVVWLAHQFAGVEVPPEVSAAFVVLLAFAGGYFKREAKA